MKWKPFTIARSGAGLLLLGALLVAGCGRSASSGKPVVTCTIFAYFDAARAVGGDKVDVRIILPPRSSPHEYEASIEDRENAGKAKIFIYNGMGLDDHFAKLASGATMIKMSDAVGHDHDEPATPAIPPTLAPATAQGHAHNHHHDHASGNPHIWLDISTQKAAAIKIRDELTKILPEHKAAFDANCEQYVKSLAELDEEFEKATAAAKRKEFIGYHEAYEHLAEHYGLKQIASVEPKPGLGNIEQTMTVVKLIKEKGIKYIAVESALDEAGIKLIQEQTGVKTVTLQPLETYDRVSDTYVELMRKNLEALKLMLAE